MDLSTEQLLEIVQYSLVRMDGVGLWPQPGSLGKRPHGK